VDEGSAGVQAILLSNQISFSLFTSSSSEGLLFQIREEFGRDVRVRTCEPQLFVHNSWAMSKTAWYLSGAVELKAEMFEKSNRALL
jgi:hypothetical protein